MTVRDEMRKYGDGLYEIRISEVIYVGSYGMMGYNKYTIFELIVENGNIYSQKIYKINSYDRYNEVEILDKFEKIEIVNNLLNLDYNNKIIIKFKHKLLEN